MFKRSSLLNLGNLTPEAWCWSKCWFCNFYQKNMERLRIFKNQYPAVRTWQQARSRPVDRTSNKKPLSAACHCVRAQMRMLTNIGPASLALTRNQFSRQNTCSPHPHSTPPYTPYSISCVRWIKRSESNFWQRSSSEQWYQLALFCGAPII